MAQTRISSYIYLVIKKRFLASWLIPDYTVHFNTLDDFKYSSKKVI